jgi:hypothetical protein
MGDVVTEALAHGLIPKGEDLSFKVRLPSIIKADAQTRGEMIRKVESMSYISKQTAAEEYIAEAEIDDYDFDAEQALIQKELGDDQEPAQLIMKDVEQVAKGAPTPSEPAWGPGEVPNLGFDANGKPVPGNGKPSNGTTPTTPGADPHDASPTSAAGAAAIRNELGRGGKQDRSTMESDDDFREYAKKRGAIVIFPD